MFVTKLVTGVPNMNRKILNISLPEELYDAVDELALAEHKSKAELTREIIREYITKRERWSEIRRWGIDTLKDSNIQNEDDLEEIIDQHRKYR
jgi:metal-responsive CopG/Arc/MetJ family transcriptional regulator